MRRYQDEKYDEIKSLLKISRVLNEQTINRINIGKDIEKSIEKDIDDEYETAEDPEKMEKKGKDDKVQKYRISGGILALHGSDKTSLDITTDEKAAFQETMDEFIEEVSDLVDFNELNVYSNNVEWSGKIIDQDMGFIFTIGESNGIYINADGIKVDDDFLTMINKLQQYYQKFKSKWSKVVASRKRTGESNQ